jgi:hypothetical protein
MAESGKPDVYQEDGERVVFIFLAFFAYSGILLIDRKPREQEERTMLDKLIINASVIDGSGAPCRNGSVGFKDGKLVMDPVDANAVEIIDAKGRVVCPGFIDPHSHGDRLIGTESGRLFKTVQGITTELAGNCGSAYAPVPRERADEIYAALGYVYPFDEVKKWSTFEKYLERARMIRMLVRYKHGENPRRVASRLLYCVCERSRALARVNKYRARRGFDES